MKFLVNYKKLRRRRYFNGFSKFDMHAPYRRHISEFLLYNRYTISVANVIQILEKNIQKYHAHIIQLKLYNTHVNSIRISNEILPDGITIDLCNKELIFTTQESV